MKKIFRFLTSSKLILALVFLINLAVFVLINIFIGYYANAIITAISLILALMFLSNSSDEPIYKTTWLFIITILPLFGSILYLYLKTSKSSRKIKKAWVKISRENAKFLHQDKVANRLLKRDKNKYKIGQYLQNSLGMPVYKNSETEFVSNGSDFFKRLIEDLKSAQEYILMEFFIIKKGKLWDEIVEILKEKVAKGVEVKVLYDDFGCLGNLTRKYCKQLNEEGIETAAFNRIIPTVNRFVNYRDHRKIVVIDGKVGYTGGINLGDEYSNMDIRFGYWKDTAIRMRGDVLVSLLAVFFNNWKIATKSEIDLEKYRHSVESIENNNLVQVFGTGPVDNEAIARNNCLNMLNNAKEYVYITTPYLVLDGEMMVSLKLAARSGVDVRIIMPGVPDKKIVYCLSRSYYQDLIDAGVKIYEYKPGFVHAKIIATDVSTFVGTINFDFRSLYLHFEDGIIMYSDPTTARVKEDIMEMLEDSVPITNEVVKGRNAWYKFFGKVLKLFAPLM